MNKRPIRILTNFRRLDESFAPHVRLSFGYAGAGQGMTRFATDCLRSDLVILDADVKRLMVACLLKWLLPKGRLKIVSVDLILRVPKSRPDRLKAWFKRLVLKQVDQFMFFFKNLRGYERFYGIGADRSVYVPFKVNEFEKIQLRPKTAPGGDYVMCAGRTMRDVNTFVEAIRLSGCPGLLHQQKAEIMAKHGTPGWNGELPHNLKLVIDDSHKHEVFLDFIAQARVVVIPRFRNDIGPAGIATYLVAMALNKCVIISEGPGAEDVLTDQAVIVPAENAESLAEQIKRLWNDDELRNDVAARGYNYAMSLGGYDRLISDVLRESMALIEDSDAEAGQGLAFTTRQSLPMAAPTGVRQTRDDA